MTVCHVLSITLPCLSLAWVLGAGDRTLSNTRMQGKRRPIKLLLPVLAFLSCYDVAAKKISTSSGSRNIIQQKLFQRNTPEGLWGDASAYAEEEEDWGGRRDNAAQSSRANPGRHGRDTDLEMPTASAAHSHIICLC